ncbi:MAG: flagellar protein FlaG [Anaerolineales bacterium]
MGELTTTQTNQISRVLSLYQGAGNNEPLGAVKANGESQNEIKAVQVKLENEQIKALNERFAKPLGDVSLKFRIDEDTHDVTVYIIDNSSKKVVRTIPPQEMAKINAGELLQLFA